MLKDAFCHKHFNKLTMKCLIMICQESWNETVQLSTYKRVRDGRYILFILPV